MKALDGVHSDHSEESWGTQVLDGDTQKRLAWSLLQVARTELGDPEEDSYQFSVFQEQHSDEYGALPVYNEGKRKRSGPGVSKPAKKTQGKTSRQKKPAKQQHGGPCLCCGTRSSPQWRRPLEDTSKVLCNACGIFYTRHGQFPDRGLLPMVGNLFSPLMSHHSHSSATTTLHNEQLPVS